MDIRPIKPMRVSCMVFEQLRELIYKGDFKPDQQLPTERDLAASMQVSRTSVRNAIDKLVKLGLLNQIQGQGTFVSSPETRDGNPLSELMTTDEATYTDLLEVRMGLECNAARLAATRAGTKDLAAMRDCLEEMAADLATTKTISTSADTAFHMAVAFAAKNPVLLNLTRNFYDFLYIGIKKNLATNERKRTCLPRGAGAALDGLPSYRRPETTASPRCHAQPYPLCAGLFCQARLHSGRYPRPAYDRLKERGIAATQVYRCHVD